MMISNISSNQNIHRKNHLARFYEIENNWNFLVIFKKQ